MAMLPLLNADRLFLQILLDFPIMFTLIMMPLPRHSLFLIIFLMMYVIFTEILFRNFYRVSSPAVFLLLLLRMIVAVTILLLCLNIIAPV